MDIRNFFHGPWPGVPGGPSPASPWALACPAVQTPPLWKAAACPGSGCRWPRPHWSPLHTRIPKWATSERQDFSILTMGVAAQALTPSRGASRLLETDPERVTSRRHWVRDGPRRHTQASFPEDALSKQALTGTGGAGEERRGSKCLPINEDGVFIF